MNLKMDCFANENVCNGMTKLKIIQCIFNAKNNNFMLKKKQFCFKDGDK